MPIYCLLLLTSSKIFKQFHLVTKLFQYPEFACIALKQTEVARYSIIAPIFFRERQKKIEKVNCLLQEGRIDEAETLRSSTAIPDKEIYIRLINVCAYIGQQSVNPSLFLTSFRCLPKN